MSEYDWIAIDDRVDRELSDDDDPFHDLDDDSEDDEQGCCFPDECVMAGEHLKGECHTAEMAEAWARQVILSHLEGMREELQHIAYGETEANFQLHEREDLRSAVGFIDSAVSRIAERIRREHSEMAEKARG